MSIQPLPLPGHPLGHLTEQVRGQVLDLDPRKDQESAVVGQQADVGAACRPGPPDVLVARTQVTRRRAPRQARQGPASGAHQELQVLPDGLHVAQVVVALQQAVEHGLALAAPHLLEAQLAQLREPAADRRLVDRHRPTTHAPGQGIGWHLPHRRKLDVAATVQLQHQPAADHVAKAAVGLPPVPGFAELRRQHAPTGGGVGRDQLLDEADLLPCDRPPSILDDRIHAPRVPLVRLERKKKSDVMFTRPEPPVATPPPHSFGSDRRHTAAPGARAPAAR